MIHQKKKSKNKAKRPQNMWPFPVGIWGWMQGLVACGWTQYLKHKFHTSNTSM